MTPGSLFIVKVDTVIPNKYHKKTIAPVGVLQPYFSVCDPSEMT